MRRTWAAICLVGIAIAGGCGGGKMSLTEYVERISAILDRGMQQYEALIASPQGKVLLAGHGPHLGAADQGAQLTDFTPQDLQVALERVGEIQADAVDAAEAIEPPEQVIELHRLYFRRLPIEALAARAGAAADWEELSESPEMAAYRNALAADEQVCTDFQAELDAAAERQAFAETPWIQSELEEVAEAALGCAMLPEHPEDAYRPPPTSTP